MGRTGQNGGGQGGRNYRFNWHKAVDGVFAFGHWRICPDALHKLPWVIFYKGAPELRPRGGQRHFKTAENAQRYIERRSRGHLR